MSTFCDDFDHSPGAVVSRFFVIDDALECGLDDMFGAEIREVAEDNAPVEITRLPCLIDSDIEGCCELLLAVLVRLSTSSKSGSSSATFESIRSIFALDSTLVIRAFAFSIRLPPPTV